MDLTSYTTLGRSGLRVSPLCLGTMTFGTDRGVDEKTCRAMFDHFVDAGGNFIDTADNYTNGQAEELLGRFIAERQLRDRIVLATKYTFNAEEGNPNAGGNGRKNLFRALDASLRRLKTDYIDLYYLHVWDLVTPAEEVLSSLNDLVRAGKIRYFGLSDCPAWYVARMQTLAEKEGKERIVTLQHEYSLVERSIEREHFPAARELGLGMCPWSPLAGGLLTGKYRRDGDGGKGEGRLNGPHQLFSRFTERNWEIVNALVEVAKELGKPAGQVALNWVATQDAVTSTILGASKLDQLKDNLAAVEFELPAELRSRLDEASALPWIHPFKMLGPLVQSRVNSGTTIRGWSER